MQPYRRLAPALGREDPQPPPAQPSFAPKRKLNPVACEECRKRKSKCDGMRPTCTSCTTRKLNCEYGADPDTSRSTMLKRRVDSLEEEQRNYSELWDYLCTRPEQEAHTILEHMRSAVGITDVLKLIRDGDLLLRFNAEGTSRPNKRKNSDSMDIEIEIAPIIDVAAEPWTRVTNDNELVSHLLSLYFTWQHPCIRLVDREIFLGDFRSGNVESMFCSPFLVNMLLSRACDHSNRSEVITENGVGNTLGARFFAEAKLAWDAELGRSTLANVQGLAEMFLKYNALGQDRMSWLVMNQAVTMSNDLRLHTHSKLEGDNFISMKLQKVRSITAWGLIQATSLICSILLRPSPLATTKAVRPLAIDDKDLSSPWSPYPLPIGPFSDSVAQSHDASYDLSEIVNSILGVFFAPKQEQSHLELIKYTHLYYRKLKDWLANLSLSLILKENGLPHVYILHVQFHVAVMTLFGYIRSSESSEIYDTLSDSEDDSTMSTQQPDADAIFRSSTIGLAKVLRSHLDAYGPGHGNCMLAVYANFCASSLLEHRDTIDIRISFHDAITTLAGICFAHRLMIAVGMMRMTQIRVHELGVNLLPETVKLFHDFDTNVWQRLYLSRFSSELPQFSEAIRRRNPFEKDAERMSDFLDRWERFGLSSDPTSASGSGAGSGLGSARASGSASASG